MPILILIVMASLLIGAVLFGLWRNGRQNGKPTAGKHAGKKNGRPI